MPQAIFFCLSPLLVVHISAGIFFTFSKKTPNFPGKTAKTPRRCPAGRCGKTAYSAGECFPLWQPSGWRGQVTAVIELMELKVAPQYLQV